MNANILINGSMSELKFFEYSLVWENNDTVTLNFEFVSVKEMNAVFGIAFKYIPNSFAEAVVEYFIENEDYELDDNDLSYLIRHGSDGLIWAIYYRKAISNKIYEKCMKILKIEK